ncbi:MAG: glycyl-radical enzyme activating protein [Firmicutes bacterium]|nr:glycyl-radical enzyme activating protein [Bacillota bacterium]
MNETMQNNKLSAIITDIQFMSTEDGPGIRSTVFMKGCPMKCLWCQNPETFSAEPELFHETPRCIDCGTCLQDCPQGALQRGERGLVFGSSCRQCLRCVENCPARAIRVFGEKVGLEELLQRLVREKPFYRHSGGGVTFSGGECLLQHRFLLAALPMLKTEGIHVCIDTAGCVSPKVFQGVAREVDLLLYDLKIIDREKHKLFTGVSNEIILENAAWLGSSGIPFRIRVPIIPGYTSGEEDIRAMAHFIRHEVGPVERIDLLGYNNLCVADYERLGLDYKLRGIPRVKKETMIRLQEIMFGSGAHRVTISNYDS